MLGYMEIWWYEVACVWCVRCVGVRRYGSMAFQIGVRMEVVLSYEDCQVHNFVARKRHCCTGHLVTWR